MYKLSDRMFFNEDKNFIKSLSMRSHKKVKCVCPFCNKERLLHFCGVTRQNSTACSACSRSDRLLQESIGKRFGRLTVVLFVEYVNNKPLVLCNCDCGNTTVVRLAEIKSGNTKSCGCLQKELLSSKVGPLNPRYNSSITDEQREIYVKQRRNSEAIRFRKAVKDRDGACVICDSTKELVVHHLENFKNNKLLRYEVSNGVTLCRACHVEFHTVFLGGYHVPCTEQDFNDYVSQI